VAGVSPVPVQMWQGVGPVPAQTWWRGTDRDAADVAARSHQR
jgi:hypothetical protein